MTDKSKYKLSASYQKAGKTGRCIRVTLKTKKLPKTTTLEDLSENWTADPHPFFELIDFNDPDMGSLTLEQVIKGKYEEWVADNPVTRALVKLLNDEKLLRKYSGSTDWKWYRKKLVRVLDELWD